MEHHKTSLRNFIPLIAIITLLILIVMIYQWYYGPNLMNGMNNFMGLFFITFSALKLINLPSFASIFRTYDIIARYSITYAYLYPFIEAALGIAYLTHCCPIITNSITIIIMLIGTLGIWRSLTSGATIQCACLGSFFNIPLTYVSLIEDIGMAVMATIMILMHITS